MESISFKSDQSQGNRLSIHLDAVGGISGDMFASAFLDLNPELMVAIKESVDEIGLGGELRLESNAFSDGVLKGQRFLVDEGASESSNHTPWKVIRERLIQSRIKQEIRENAIGIFKCLAEAEALVHGIDVEEVVFHEVGAVDSMVDVLAASVILDAYHEANWFLGNLPLGRGEVQTAHGKLPLPAPAVVELLKGFDFHDDGETGERVTPTGAAILRFLTESRGLSRKPETIKRKLLSSGQGFGSRKLKTKSNLLRVLVFGPEETSPEEDWIAVLRFEVDDQTSEDLAVALGHLRDSEGVLDVTQWPVYGKKGRIVFSVQILARPEASETVIEMVFNETTTLGVRYREESRKILERSEIIIDDSRVKLARRPSVLTAKVEMEDLSPINNFSKREESRKYLETQVLRDHETNRD